MSVKITGLNELNRAINKKIKDVEKAAKKRLEKGLMLVRKKQSKS
ncbi:hypothetical protein NYR76_02805 [Actinobacillus equuli subsp. equuli]|nr:hypothetical protein [Actinobacillus equuli]WGE65906.1 hypothetical protein NYR76_02805 [Actinobacillus equuli subsp. equuli]